MKLYHKSYWKTILLAAGAGCGLTCIVLAWMLFGTDMVGRLGASSALSVLHWALPVAILAAALFCFAVCVGGLLCVYKDLTQDGRP